jgi:hypothetical protein
VEMERVMQNRELTERWAAANKDRHLRFDELEL